MLSFSSHDLRRKCQRFSDLRRRYEAHEQLPPDELAELRRGIPAEEMHEIIEAIRKDRRAATPTKKTAKAEKDRQPSTPIDLQSFLDDEQDVPNG